MLIELLGENYIRCKQLPQGNIALPDRTVVFHAGRAQGNTGALIEILNCTPLRQHLYPKVLIVTPRTMQERYIRDQDGFPRTDRNVMFVQWADEIKLRGLREWDLVVFHMFLQSDIGLNRMHGWINEQGVITQTILVLE